MGDVLQTRGPGHQRAPPEGHGAGWGGGGVVTDTWCCLGPRGMPPQGRIQHHEQPELPDMPVCCAVWGREKEEVGR